jgi:hypothetical protein
VLRTGFAALRMPDEGHGNCTILPQTGKEMAMNYRSKVLELEDRLASDEPFALDHIHPPPE